MQITFLRAVERANVRSFRLSVQSPFAARNYIWRVSRELNVLARAPAQKMKFIGILGLFALVGSMPSTPGQPTSTEVLFTRPQRLSLIDSLNSPIRNVRTFRESLELGSVGMEIASAQLPAISPILPAVGGSGLPMEITMKYSRLLWIPPTHILPGLFIRTATSTVGMYLMMEFREKGHNVSLPPQEYSLGPLQTRASLQSFYYLELKSMQSWYDFRQSSGHSTVSKAGEVTNLGKSSFYKGSVVILSARSSLTSPRN